MKFLGSNSDDATLKELGKRIVQYRLNKNWTQEVLATEAGVSKKSVHRVEHGHIIRTLNLIRILRALRLLDNLEMLIPEPAISPIQLTEMQGKKRKRASSKPDKSSPQTPWLWGDDEDDQE